MDISCFENIVKTWLFAVLSIGVTSQDKGGYVMVLKFFSGFSIWNWPFYNIFLKYRSRLLGGTKGNLHILIKGSNFACVEIKNTIFFGKIEFLVLNEKNVFKSNFQHSKGSGRSIYLIWEYIGGLVTCLGSFFFSFSAKKGNFPCLVWLHQNFKSWFNVILVGQRCLELIFII